MQDQLDLSHQSGSCMYYSIGLSLGTDAFRWKDKPFQYSGPAFRSR